MAFDISTDSFLEKTKIDLEKEFGEGAYVELREPTKREFLAMQKAYEAGPTDFEEKFTAMLPSIIIGHGFTAAGKPATNEQVAAAIGKKTVAQNKVEVDYLTWATAPFLKAKEPASKA